MSLNHRFSLSLALVLGVSWALGCNDDAANPASPNGLTLTCAARPVGGPAPLGVSFTLAVSGANGPYELAVNYGDGTAGSDPNAAHLYRAAGTYTASFSAQTATQTASCTASVTVTAPPGSPSAAGDQPPDAVFKTNPPSASGRIQGSAPLEVQFNMCPTVDPEHDPLLFTMDFQGDGITDSAGSTGVDCRHGFVYARGVYRPRICVTDLTGPAGQALHPPQCDALEVDAR